MGINRFSQPVQTAGYKPLSFQELAFAPIQMRQREDRMEAAKSEILNQANNMQFYDGYHEEADKVRKGLIDEFNQLSSDIIKNGAGLDAVNRLNNLRNKYNQQVSASGLMGRAAGVKKTIDSKKQAYMQYAIQNAKQSPEDAERNFQTELGKYKQGLPSKLDDFEGEMPEFNPTLAPEHQDLAAHMKKYYELAGKIRDKYQNVEFKPQKDANGNITGYHVFQNGSLIENNDENIQKLTQLVQNELFNPKSALARDLAYKNMTPEYMMEQVDLMGDMMTTKNNETTTDYQTTIGDGTATGGRRGGSGSTAAPKDTVSLVEVEANSTPEIPYTETVETINARVDELERDQLMDPVEKEQKLSALRFAKMDKLKAREDYMKSEEDSQELSPTYKEDRNKLIQSNEKLQKLGINTWEEYEAAKKNPYYTEKYQDYIPKRNAYGRPIRNPDGSYWNPELVTFVPRLQDVDISQVEQNHEQLLETKADHRVTANSDNYTFGFGNADVKLNETLSKSLPAQQIMGLAAKGLVEMSNGDAQNLMYEKLDPEKHQQFVNLLNTGGLKFTYGAINSGSAAHPPQIVFTAENSDKFKRDFAISLKDNAFTREFLSPDGPLYTSLDADGQRVIDNIRDNVEYAGLPTADDLSVNTNVNEMFSKEQSDQVLSYSKKANSGLLSQIQNSDPETQTPMEKMISNTLFMKNDGNTYGVTVNRDKSFSSYRRDPNTQKIEPYTLDNYFDKKVMEQYAVKYMAGSFHPDMMNSPEIKDKIKQTKVYELISYYKPIKDINNITKEALFYGANVPKFEKSIKEIHQIWNSSKSKQQKEDEIYEIYKNIKDMRLQSKRKKEVL